MGSEMCIRDSSPFTSTSLCRKTSTVLRHRGFCTFNSRQILKFGHFQHIRALQSLRTFRSPKTLQSNGTETDDRTTEIGSNGCASKQTYFRYVCLYHVQTFDSMFGISVRYQPYCDLLNAHLHTFGTDPVQNHSEFRTEQQQKSQNNNSYNDCLLYTSPSPRDLSTSRMPSSA